MSLTNAAPAYSLRCMPCPMMQGGALAPQYVTVSAAQTLLCMNGGIAILPGTGAFPSVPIDLVSSKIGSGGQGIQSVVSLVTIESVRFSWGEGPGQGPYQLNAHESGEWWL